MLSHELFELLSQYKFHLAFENAVCDDYITEKLWRPLTVGSVPVYFGSPSIEVIIFNTTSILYKMQIVAVLINFNFKGNVMFEH